jgi:hypothetical protein
MFMSNVAIAVSIAAVVALFHQSHWLVRLENSAMDTMMEFNKGLPRMSDTNLPGSLQFTFMDIDDASYQRWNEPFHVPRDKILDLVITAAAANARLIVLDIDLSREGINAGDDLRLATYLEGYGAENSSPPLILVRTFFGGNSKDQQWLEIRPSFLDNYELSPSVHWGQPLFKATLWDGVIRHWHLVKYGCLNGSVVLVPATQLIAAAILSGTDVGTKTGEVALNAVNLRSCSRSDESSEPMLKKVADNDVATISTAAEFDQRLIYSIPWKDPAPDLITVPAHIITESTRDLSADLIENRVVIIGASFADSRDIHRTPIGEMPGALIIANAIKSLSFYGQLRKPPVFAQWFEKLSLIFVAAWLFSRFDSLIAVTLSGAILIIALVPISFHLFKYGMWVDFAIPLFAMLIHRGVAEFRSYQSTARKPDG